MSDYSATLNAAMIGTDEEFNRQMRKLRRYLFAPDWAIPETPNDGQFAGVKDKAEE